MTTSKRVKGVLVGLAGITCGLFTVALATGMLSFPPASSGPCMGVSDCEKSCTRGRSDACRDLGLAYLQGMAVERSRDRGLAYLRTACNAGDALGCTALGGVMLELGNTDISELRAILVKACDAGEVMGCNNLAATFEQDPGRDLAQAHALYEKACSGGSGMACSTLAKALLAGDGIAQDPARAKVLFARSATILQAQCDQGNGRACGQAGWLYERGLGVEKDAAKAQRDYQTGCDGNDAASCYNLATVGPANSDESAARELLAKACRLGMPQACGSR